MDGAKDARALAAILRRVGLALRRSADGVTTISPAACPDVGAAAGLAGSSSSQSAAVRGGNYKLPVLHGPAVAFLVPVVNASRTGAQGPELNCADTNKAGRVLRSVAVSDRGHGRQLFLYENSNHG